ncbi:MAG TPA: hypothetical protein PKK06_04310 [Phycisphaerae bacterium]|nr:hypothetical protein [Phycisphaerae bacterium]HNU46187.1 hypothetical protein [Phycisphaerae bacterium]
MRARPSKPVLSLVWIGVLLTCSPAVWAADYYSTANPGTTAPPNSPWQVVVGNVNFNFGVGGGDIWFATTNAHMSTNRKSYTLTLTGATTVSLYASGAWGYYDGGSSTSLINYWSENLTPPTRLVAHVTLTPQPDWEVVKISSNQAGVHSVSVSSAANCSHIDFDGSTWDYDGWWGPPGGSFRYTAVIAFPTNVMVNPSVTPTFTAPPQTGTWQYSFVYTDPYGAPMPNGGVRWETTGMGLTEQVQYQSSFAVQGSANTTYWYYAFDASDSQWDVVWIEPPPGTVPATDYWGLGGLAVCLIGLGAVLVIRRQRARPEAA